MRLFVFVAVIGSAACSIFGNSPPLDVRYYDVEAPEHRVTTRSAVAEGNIELALGKARSSEFLRNHIVYREPDEAIREYETARWTEYPEVYMKRALTNALYDGGAFIEAKSAGAAVLDVELLAFEERRRADGGRAGRVQISYRVRHDERVLASDTISVERMATDASMTAVVQSLEEALDDATHRIAAITQQALASEAQRTSRP